MKENIQRHNENLSRLHGVYFHGIYYHEGMPQKPKSKVANPLPLKGGDLYVRPNTNNEGSKHGVKKRHP